MSENDNGSAADSQSPEVIGVRRGMSSIKFFRDEYFAHLSGGCPFDPHASTLMATEGVGV